MLLFRPLYFPINARFIFIISRYNCGNICYSLYGYAFKQRALLSAQTDICVCMYVCASICLWLLFSWLRLNVIIQTLVPRFSSAYNDIYVCVCVFSIYAKLSKCACARVFAHWRLTKCHAQHYCYSSGTKRIFSQTHISMCVWMCLYRQM